jgi:hypothetical protein
VAGIEMEESPGDELIRLRRENQALRDRTESTPHVPAGSAGPGTAQPAGCLRLIGLIVICCVVGSLVFFLLSLYPPWVRVKGKYQHLLYSSILVKEYDREFVGFDSVDSEAKKQTDRHAVRPSGTVFDATEYRIDWSLLWGEWFLACGLIAAGAYVATRRRKTAAQGA